MQLLSSRQGGQRFWDWQLEVAGLNFSLPVERRLLDERLQEFLEANLNPNLQVRLRTTPAGLDPPHADQVAKYMAQLVIANAINVEGEEPMIPTPPEVPLPSTVAHNHFRQWLEHVKKLLEQVADEQARIRVAAEEAVRLD